MCSKSPQDDVAFNCVNVNENIPPLSPEYNNICPFKLHSFPLKLFEVITSEDKSIIDFLPDGCGFKITDTPSFRDKVLPKYFRTKKIPSFTKQLNLYGFKRINDGLYLGAYIHPDFIRGRRDLAMSICKIIKESPDTALESSSGEEHTTGELSCMEKSLSRVLAQISHSAIAHHCRLFKWNSLSNKVGLNFINSEQFVGERYVGDYDSEGEAFSAVEAILSGGDHVWSIEHEHHAIFKRIEGSSSYRLLYRNSDRILGSIEVGVVRTRLHGHAIIHRILGSDDEVKCIQQIRDEMTGAKEACAELVHKGNNWTIEDRSSVCSTLSPVLSEVEVDGESPNMKRHKSEEQGTPL